MMDERAASAASLELRSLARKLAYVYVAELHPRAIILAGSAAEGIADGWSDLDLIVFHDTLPEETAITDAREHAGGGAVTVLAPWDGSAYLESFPLDGVECQVGHESVESVERDMAAVLEQLDVESPTQKALDGLLHCLPLHGADLIERWRGRVANYPDALRRAMVERHLRFFPLWMVDHRMASRDATLFRQEMLVDASLNLLAVLAGLNRVYFSRFQFRRMHRFADGLAVKPDDLAERLESLFDTQPAGEALEALVGETVALVERELPDVDTKRARRWLGQRPRQWTVSP